MSAHRDGNLLHYKVDSRSRPGVQHVVELEHYDGHGACTCEHFCFGLERHLKNGVRPDNFRARDKLRCEHIREALEQLAVDVIEATRNQNKKRDDETRRRNGRSVRRSA